MIGLCVWIMYAFNATKEYSFILYPVSNSKTFVTSGLMLDARSIFSVLGDLNDLLYSTLKWNLSIIVVTPIRGTNVDEYLLLSL